MFSIIFPIYSLYIPYPKRVTGHGATHGFPNLSDFWKRRLSAWLHELCSTPSQLRDRYDVIAMGNPHSSLVYFMENPIAEVDDDWETGGFPYGNHHILYDPL